MDVKSMSSGSDTSSITATTGSPPGSNLANDDIQDWARDVDGAGAVDIADTIDSMGRDSFNAPDGSSPNGYHSEGDEVRDSATGLASMEDDEVCVEDDESDSDHFADSHQQRLKMRHEELHNLGLADHRRKRFG